MTHQLILTSQNYRQLFYFYNDIGGKIYYTFN